jgi:hypothetical protein
MPGNVAATAFWRRVIGEATGEHVVEQPVTQGWWQGLVQQFDVDAEASSPSRPDSQTDVGPRQVLSV